MLIIYGIAHTPTVAAVLVYEAVGLLVPSDRGPDRLPAAAAVVRQVAAHSYHSPGASVEVIDQGDGFERMVRELFETAGGHGLNIVDAIASPWGIHEGASHVWFELERGPDSKLQSST
jgi:hypothetical protein